MTSNSGSGTSVEFEEAEGAVVTVRDALERVRELFYQGHASWSVVAAQQSVVEFAEANLIRADRARHEHAAVA